MSDTGNPKAEGPPIVVQGSLVNNSGASTPGAYPSQETKKPTDDYENSVHYSLEVIKKQWPLPPGWIVAVNDYDGRLFYREVATGRTSLTHPMAAPNSQSNYNPMERGGDGLEKRTNLLDTPGNAGRRPDSHQCCACVSLVTCLPMGLCAMFHSYKVDQAWKVGNYGDAVNHSRQAYNYACWGTVIGIVVLAIWFFRTHDFEFPDFDFG